MPGGITARHRDDGKRVWDFPAPPADRYPASLPLNLRPILDPRPPEPLEGFQLAEGRLFFTQGKRLFALDTQTGQALWFHQTFPAANEAQLFCAGPTSVLLQSPTGRQFLLDAASGRRVQPTAPTFGRSSTPPLLVNGCFLIAVTEPPRVIALDAHTGRQRWSHAIPGNTTLTGAAPLLVPGDDSLLVVTPTNLGCAVERLQLATGQPLWPQPLPLRLSNLEVGGLALDSASFYVAGLIAGDNPAAHLQCGSLADGRLVWERPLAGAAFWAVRRVREALVCYPSSRRAAQFRVAWPWGALQWEQDQPLASEAGYPVVCCDARSGLTVQHLNFECSPRLRWARRVWGSLDLTVGRTVAETPAFRPGPAGAVLALASDVWGLVVD
jgi:hypothetical protein